MKYLVMFFLSVFSVACHNKIIFTSSAMDTNVSRKKIELKDINKCQKDEECVVVFGEHKFCSTYPRQAINKEFISEGRKLLNQLKTKAWTKCNKSEEEGFIRLLLTEAYCRNKSGHCALKAIDDFKKTKRHRAFEKFRACNTDNDCRLTERICHSRFPSNGRFIKELTDVLKSNASQLKECSKHLDMLRKSDNSNGPWKKVLNTDNSSRCIEGICENVNTLSLQQ